MCRRTLKTSNGQTKKTILGELLALGILKASLLSTPNEKIEITKLRSKRRLRVYREASLHTTSGFSDKFSTTGHKNVHLDLLS